MAAVVCDAPTTLGMLSEDPQPALTWFDRWVAFLTTLFKRAGIDGWKETGCAAEGNGAPVHDAQHSTDGFWTIDVELSALSIGQTPASLVPPRYLRLEIEPRTRAHAACAATPVRRGTPLSFGGAVVIDRDANFLEIHPDEDFQISTVPPAQIG